MSLLTIILLIFLTLLIIISGFLSGSETALTASSKPRIVLKYKKGNKKENGSKRAKIDHWSIIVKNDVQTSYYGERRGDSGWPVCC